MIECQFIFILFLFLSLERQDNKRKQVKRYFLRMCHSYVRFILITFGLFVSFSFLFLNQINNLFDNILCDKIGRRIDLQFDHINTFFFLCVCELKKVSDLVDVQTQVLFFLSTDLSVMSIVLSTLYLFYSILYYFHFFFFFLGLIAFLPQLFVFLFIAKQFYAKLIQTFV